MAAAATATATVGAASLAAPTAMLSASEQKELDEQKVVILLQSTFSIQTSLLLSVFITNRNDYCIRTSYICGNIANYKQ
jgi:hypothetical protein